MRKIEPNPARAESRGLRVSSVSVKALSQPQKMYTDRMIPVAASLADGAVNGLNHDSVDRVGAVDRRIPAEADQHQVLEGDQRRLQPRDQAGAAQREVGQADQHDQADDRGQRDGGRVERQAEDAPPVALVGEGEHHRAAYLAAVGQVDRGAGQVHPAALEAEPGAQRAADPGVARAEVALGAVEPAEGERDAEDRQHREQHHRRDGGAGIQAEQAEADADAQGGGGVRHGDHRGPGHADAGAQALGRHCGFWAVVHRMSFAEGAAQGFRPMVRYPNSSVNSVDATF